MVEVINGIRVRKDVKERLEKIKAFAYQYAQNNHTNQIHYSQILFNLHLPASATTWYLKLLVKVYPTEFKYEDGILYVLQPTPEEAKENKEITKEGFVVPAIF